MNAGDAAEEPVEAGLDARVIVRGAAICVALALTPPQVVHALRHDDIDARSPLWIVAAVLSLLVAPSVAGIVSAIAKREQPAQHGAAAGGLAAVVIVVYGFARKLSQGNPPDLVSLVLVGLVQLSAATIAATAVSVLHDRRAQRHPSPPPPAPDRTARPATPPASTSEGTRT